MKIKSSTIITYSLFAALLAFIAISNVNIVSAAAAPITGGSVTPSSTADFVVGKANAVYKVSFVSPTSTQTTSITIGFPVGYVITTTTIGTSNVTALNGNPASFTLGNATSAITAVTGVTSTRNVIITMASTTLTASTTSFYILSGITNATTSGATATTSISTSAEAGTSTAAITLVMDTLLLKFTTQPAVATSGFAFVTQPHVTAQDQFANVSSTYAKVITLTPSGTGTLAGGTTSTAAAGSSTFTGVQYNAITDNEVFFLTASDDLVSTTSTNLTAKVVATKLVFTTQPGNGNSGVPLSPQPVVAAEDALGVLDVDFASIVTLTTTSTTAGTISNTGITAVAGIAQFGNLFYVPAVNGESFMLTASGGGLTTIDSASRVGFLSAGGSGTPYVGTNPVVTTPTPTPTPTPVVTTPVVTTPVVNTPVLTATSQQEQINTLVSQLKALIMQASAMGIAIPDSMKAYLNSSKLSDMGNLSLGSTGSAVKMLQQFLNGNGSMVAATGAGSPGNETTRFGGATKAALIKYQSSVGISPASGMFGPITRTYLKSIGF